MKDITAQEALFLQQQGFITADEYRDYVTLRANSIKNAIANSYNDPNNYDDCAKEDVEPSARLR